MQGREKPKGTPSKTGEMATYLHDKHYPVDIDRIPINESGDVRILDIGGGKGTDVVNRLQQKIGPRAHVVTVDFFEENLKEDPKYPRQEKRVADARDLPFPDGSFDIVITGELTPDNFMFVGHERLADSAPQVENLRALRHEIDRVLASDGHYVAYHESTDVIPSRYRTIYEQRPTYQDAMPMERLANGRGFSTGLIYGVYAKENPDPGNMDTLFHLLDDTLLGKEDRMALWRTLGLLLSEIFRGVPESEMSEEVLQEFERQHLERARWQILDMPTEEQLQVVNKMFENNRWLQELEMPSEELKREMYLYHWCAEALHRGEKYAHRWFYVAEHLHRLPEESPLYKKMAEMINGSGNEKLIAQFEKHRASRTDSWDEEDG